MTAPLVAASKLPAQSSLAEPCLTPRVPPFSAIYREYFEFVWVSARRQGVELEAVEDLVQEVFVVIHNRLETLEHPESLRSWIYGIVRRTVSAYRRSRCMREGSGLVMALECQTGEVASVDVAEQREKVRLLSELLDELDPPKREVFMLVELEEFTVPEIASLLGVPVNTVYSRLRAARMAFEAALARHNTRCGDKPCRT